MSEEYTNPYNDPNAPLGYANYTYWNNDSAPRRTSPMLANMMPNMQERSNVYVGNHAMSPPGGINLGNPLATMLGSLAMNVMFGGNVRPLQRPDMPMADYLESRERYTKSMSLMPAVSAMDPGLARFGDLGKNPLFQMGYDMFNPHGSMNGAFQSIYGRLGTRMGGDSESQADWSMKMLGQMNEQFRTGGPASKYDYSQTYGFDRQEMIEASDAGLRYNIGGLTNKGLKEDVESGHGAERMKKQAKVFNAASEIFGKDKGMDELAQLMTRSIDGFQGLDEDKATQLLNKIQATSKAIGVSTKAFAEYSAMMSQLYKSQGQGGITSAGKIMDAALGAEVGNQLLARDKDATGGGLNQAMEDAAKSKLYLANSPTMRQATAALAMVNDLTPAQRAGTIEKSVTKLKAALASGNGERMDKAVLDFQQENKGNPYFNDLWRRSAQLSEHDKRAANAEFDMSKMADVNGLRVRTDLARQVTSEGILNKNQVNKLGGAAGLEKIMSSLNSQEAMSSPEKVKEAIRNSPQGRGMSERELDDISAKVAGQYNSKLGDINVMGEYGLESDHEVTNALSRSGSEAVAEQEKMRKYTQERADKIGSVQDKSGRLNRKYGISGIIDDAMDILPFMEGKEWNLKNVKEALGRAGGNISAASDIVENQYRLKEKGIDLGEGKKKLDGIQKEMQVKYKSKYDDVFKKTGDSGLAETEASKTAKDYFEKEAKDQGIEYLTEGKDGEKAPKEKAVEEAKKGAEKEKANESWREQILAAVKGVERNTKPPDVAVTAPFVDVIPGKP